MRDSKLSKRSQRTKIGYERLEDRRVLTATSLDLATGTLDINLDSNFDQAVVAIDNGLVSVNGATDLDNGQTLDAADLRTLNINGNAFMTGQSVTLNDDYSVGNGAGLLSVNVLDVGSLLIGGQYELQQNLTVALSESGSGVTDGGSGQLIVHGATDIDAFENQVALLNSANEFHGTVSLETLGVDNDRACRFRAEVANHPTQVSGIHLLIVERGDGNPLIDP